MQTPGAPSWYRPAQLDGHIVQDVNSEEVQRVGVGRRLDEGRQGRDESHQKDNPGEGAPRGRGAMRNGMLAQGRGSSNSFKMHLTFVVWDIHKLPVHN